MIGVFDSGVGGLTVLKEFIRVLPEYDYIYFGDSGRAPYGDKTEKEIYRFTCEGVDFLFSKGCELIVIACNTASAKALRKIQREYLPKRYPNKKVLGVVVPTIEEIVAQKHRRVALIGTRATIRSKKYEKEIFKFDKNIEIFGKTCPLLVPLIERGELSGPFIDKTLESYLAPVKKYGADSLVLGCTHYPLIFDSIKKVLGGKIKVINPPVIIAKKLKDYLKRHQEIEKKIKKGKTVDFYTSGSVARFRKVGEKFLANRISQVRKVSIKKEPAP